MEKPQENLGRTVKQSRNTERLPNEKEQHMLSGFPTVRLSTNAPTVGTEDLIASGVSPAA
eukprot:4457712-Pyramimonas_sp.AAC.1